MRGRITTVLGLGICLLFSCASEGSPTSTPVGSSPVTTTGSPSSPSGAADPGRCWRPLQAIDGVAPDAIWAVGEACETPFVVRWDGIAWEEEAVPVTTEGHLVDVVALDTDEAWAVGWGYPGTRAEPILLHRANDVWVETDPPAIEGDIYVNGVAARAPDDVWAVGEIDGGPLVIRWDGVHWRRFPFPFRTGDLGSVVVLRRSTWVGEAYGRTLARWNGTEWRKVLGPKTPAGALHLVGLGTDGRDLWGVGSTGESPEQGIVARALVVRRTEGRWEIEREGPFAWLVDVSFDPDGTGWTVGGEGPDGGSVVFRRRRDGAWPPVEHPRLGRDRGLRGVLAFDDTQVWAVGWFERADGHEDYRSLALLWDGTAWVKTPVPRT